MPTSALDPARDPTSPEILKASNDSNNRQTTFGYALQELRASFPWREAGDTLQVVTLYGSALWFGALSLSAWRPSLELYLLSFHVSELPQQCLYAQGASLLTAAACSKVIKPAEEKPHTWRP